ncbi:CsbD family protein [Streptomyces avermitilis]|uniref:CsbD family protein n=1 Tax=Streptomyces avermitilis TaxID=33903 RepID=UPI00339F506C
MIASPPRTAVIGANCTCSGTGQDPDRLSATDTAMKGGVKRRTGRATGNRRLHAEGRGDQVKGSVKQAGAKIKDAFKH